MGLIVGVHSDRSMPDATNGGVSTRGKGLCLVNVEGPFEPNESYPAAILVEGPLGNPVVMEAEQVDGEWAKARKPDQVGPMFGGNFAATSDSRFRRAVPFYGAVPIHDRYETPEQYRALSI